MGFLNPHGRGHPVPRASPCKSPLASPGHPPGGCLGKKVSLRTTSLWDVVKNACALERIPSTLWKNLATAFNSNSTTPYTTHEWAPYFFQGGVYICRKPSFLISFNVPVNYLNIKILFPISLDTGRRYTYFVMTS
jgi:hypothetical protein